MLHFALPSFICGRQAGGCTNTVTFVWTAVTQLHRNRTRTEQDERTDGWMNEEDLERLRFHRRRTHFSIKLLNAPSATALPPVGPW